MDQSPLPTLARRRDDPLSAVNKQAPLIAVVDDEEAVGRAIQRLLRSAGFRVISFSSGALFLGSLVQESPDCVVLDIHMPVMDGFRVLQHLHEMKVHFPVIAITGHDTPEMRRNAINAGAAGFFTKPVDAQGLIDSVEKALCGKHTS